MLIAVHQIPKSKIGNRTQTARLGSGALGCGFGTGYRAGAAAVAVPGEWVETVSIPLPPHFTQKGASLPVSIPHWLQNIAAPREASFVRLMGTWQHYEGNNVSLH